METVLLQAETISKSCGGDETKQNRWILQVQTTEELQIRVARLEQQLAASISLAAERLEEIIQLKSSLASVTNERDTCMVDCLKFKKEISSLKSYVKSLKKQHRKMDNSRAWAEVEVLRTQLAAWSHYVGSQAIRIQLLQREIHELVFVGWVGDTKCVPQRHSNKGNDDPVMVGMHPLASESMMSQHVSMSVETAPVMQPITWLQEDHCCNAVGVEGTSPSSSLAMRPEVASETAAVEAYSRSQGVSRSDSICVSEPMSIYSEAVPKRDTSSAGVQIEVGERFGDVVQKTSTSSAATGFVRDHLASTSCGNASTKVGKIGATHHKLTYFYKGPVPEVEANCNNQDMNMKDGNSEDFIEDRQQNAVNCNVPGVKVKQEIFDDNCVYDLDHVPLVERIKMLGSKCFLQVAGGESVSESDISILKQEDALMGTEEKTQGVDLVGLRVCKKRKKSNMGLQGAGFEACGSGRNGMDRENTSTRFIARRRRKKTATDSVETALEEDAPGLLQVLLDKGIKVGEIKLYGDREDEDAPEIVNDTEFLELETIISKVFSQPSTLLKFPLLRHSRGGKASYCLSCLISLVEQTQYLQFRKWPVEWGWCRELQSFIFVFERHNRIVLERPEYGYATYFFELVDSVPINWQIKRLVTIMKLSNCGRNTLIENRPLQVGEDLTEGEARILEEYGWRPNHGLGSMLNYCDRVVHDRKSEGDSSEWKSKIGKLLMQGYDGGTVVMAKLPRKLRENGCNSQTQMKVEWLPETLAIESHPEMQMKVELLPKTQTETDGIPEMEIKVGSNPETEIKAGGHPETQVKMEPE
ncbi:hypothetical protein H6P81_016359 [Aristolochia fimbriata]|uniref:Uncharacterized protein n=1 Tax=Aristolochia fimbriata TaxID=158543 RepID=A0AAV7E8R9_ARIFI|nr:hypothetical protein H6P81_016359 [Aristolochia fimbriata]